MDVRVVGIFAMAVVADEQVWVGGVMARVFANITEPERFGDIKSGIFAVLLVRASMDIYSTWGKCSKFVHIHIAMATKMLFF